MASFGLARLVTSLLYQTDRYDVVAITAIGGLCPRRPRGRRRGAACALDAPPASLETGGGGLTVRPRGAKPTRRGALRKPGASPNLAWRCSSGPVRRGQLREHGRCRRRPTSLGHLRYRPAVSGARVIDIPIAGPLLSIAMSVIAQAIADRQSEIDRLQAEIKALTDVEQILGASAPPSRPTSRRSSSPRKAAAAATESKSEVAPERKRRKMSAAEKKAVSERMTAYWAERKKKAAKKK